MADEGAEVYWPRKEEIRGVRIRHGSRQSQGRLANWAVTAASHLSPLTVFTIPGTLDNAPGVWTGGRQQYRFPHSKISI